MNRADPRICEFTAKPLRARKQKASSAGAISSGIRVLGVCPEVVSIARLICRKWKAEKASNARSEYEADERTNPSADLRAKGSRTGEHDRFSHCPQHVP